MSNTAVGPLYKRIIDSVIESSRTDFEENGIENKVLVALQECWQTRLSISSRAHFPWDPQPPPPVPVAATNHSMRQATPSVPLQNTPNQQNGGGVTIKQEPRHDQPFVPIPQASNYTSNPQYAQQRAAVLLQQQFGNQANGSIAAMQSNGLVKPGGQQQRPQGLQLPGQVQNANQAQRQQLQQPKQEPRDSVGLSQTDGAGEAAEEWDAILSDRNSRGEHERPHADRIIRRQVDQSAQRLEAGGLLIPLDERRKALRLRKTSKHSHGPAEARSRAEVAGSAASTYESTSALPPVARFDGGDSDDGLDDDEDAINSDLDDSDDGGEAGIESNMDGDVVLCLYDKVQRVKNKWKCVLKDGVVTVNGKDYVFHKAQGEFEW